MTSDVADGHKSIRLSEIKPNAEDVRRLFKAFKNFMSPFEIPNYASDLLLCIASGKSASTAVTNDLLSYVSSGETAAQVFINDRLLSTKLKFHNPMKKLRLQTFKT
jgi:hypothetical protein